MGFGIAKPKLARLQIALCAGAMIAFFAAYYPALYDLVQGWYHSDDQSYGIFIIPFSLYFIFKNKKKWVGAPIDTSLLGATAFTISILIYIFGQIAEVATLSSLGLVFTIWSSIWFLFGMSLFKAILFPLCLLLLMIPIPAQLYSLATVPLQLFVSKVSAGAAQLIGVPIYREGNVLILPNHTLAVVQACSGLRSLMALITLCIVYGYMTLKNNWLRATITCCAVPVALLANILRVIVMVISFYYFEFDLAHGPAHTAFGVFIFAFGLFAIAFIKGVLSRWDGVKVAH